VPALAKAKVNEPKPEKEFEHIEPKHYATLTRAKAVDHKPEEDNPASQNLTKEPKLKGNSRQSSIYMKKTPETYVK
jgi:hypothetical protein